MLFLDLGDALIPSQRASRTTWGNGLPTTPTAAYLAAEGISPTTGPGREGEKKMLWCCDDDVVMHLCVQ